MPPRRNRPKKIDPDLLPESITQPGPHESLLKFFTEEEPPKELFEQWADFYEKKPQIAIRELITVVLFIGCGFEIEITDKDIQKNQTKKVEDEFSKKLEEAKDDTPIDEFFKGTNEKAYTFWNHIGNSLIVSKGLFSDEFDDFIKGWLFTFCESPDRALRSSSTAAICSIIQFLSDSINTSNIELQKLKKGSSKSKSTKSSVVNHQIESFETELDNSRSLAMELFTSVIRPRARDVDQRIRDLCIKTMGEISILAPEDFANLNFTKLLGNALTDESTKNRKQAIKQMEAILSSNSDIDEYKPFFKQYSPTLVKICNDTDNTLATSAIHLMIKMHKMKVFYCNEEDVNPIFKLTADDQANVRDRAAKFFVNFIFNGTLLEDEDLKGSKKRKKQVLNEAQLNKFAELAKDFSESELTNSIQAFSPLLECFQNWNLISEIIFSSDDKSERSLFVKILSISASFVPEEETSDLTVTMIEQLHKVNKVKGLLDLFQKNDTELLYLTQILQYMDINTLSDEMYEGQFKSLLQKLEEIFKSNVSKPVYLNIINGIYKWSSVLKLAKSKLESIAKSFSNLEGSDSTKLDKFLAIATFYDFSKNTKLRDYLKEHTDNEDDEDETNDKASESSHISAIAIKCLETLYKWDVKRLRKEEKKDKTDYFAEFDSLQRIFIQNLHSPVLEIKTAAFCALGSLLSLAKFAIDDISYINRECFEPFIDTYHELGNNKLSSFKSLIRPILSRVIPMEYAIHAFWYLQDDDLKLYVRDFMKDINEEDYPINGSEIGKLFNIIIKIEAKGKVSNFVKPPLLKKAKDFVREIANKKRITPRDAILSYINNNNAAEELIPIYAPIFENMSYADAEFVKPSAGGKVLSILSKILAGKKLKPKDFIVTVKNSKDDDYDDDDEAEAESEGTD